MADPTFRTMRQVISSGWTLVFKFLVPLGLLMVSIFLLMSLLIFPVRPRSNAVIGTLIVVGATVFFCWWGAKLKVISVDQHNLYVSNLIREISIPLANIYGVDALQGGWPVIVRLKEKSEFGRTIFFLAAWQPLLFGSPHPVLEQLRQLVSANHND